MGNVYPLERINWKSPLILLSSYLSPIPYRPTLNLPYLSLTVCFLFVLCTASPMQAEGSPFPLPSHISMRLSQLVNFQRRKDGLHYPGYIFLDKDGTMTALFVWFLNTSRITPVFLLLSHLLYHKQKQRNRIAIKIVLFILKNCAL
jgi:hypothetical protein